MGAYVYPSSKTLLETVLKWIPHTCELSKKQRIRWWFATIRAYVYPLSDILHSDSLILGTHRHNTLGIVNSFGCDGGICLSLIRHLWIQIVVLLHYGTYVYSHVCKFYSLLVWFMFEVCCHLFFLYGSELSLIRSSQWRFQTHFHDFSVKSKW